MNKTEYINALQAELKEFGEEFRKDLVDTFEEHFAEGASRGLSEEQISQELGNVYEVASGIKSLADHSDERVSPDSQRKSDNDTAGFINPSQNLVIEALDTSTDIYLMPGSQLRYRMEAQEGFTIGNGVFFRSPLFKRWQHAEVKTDYTDTQSRITVHGAGGKLFVDIPPEVVEISMTLSSGDINLKNISARNLTARTSSGDIIVSESRINDAKMQSVSGDVKITGLSGSSIELYSVSGDIEGRDLCGNVHGKTASGDIEIRHHEDGMLDVSTKSGDIDVVSTGSGTAASISGDINLYVNEGADNLQASSTSGDIKCKIAGTDFEAYMTSVSGSVRNKTALSGTKNDSQLHIGQGKTQITLKSISGNVTLQNA